MVFSICCTISGDGWGGIFGSRRDGEGSSQIKSDGDACRISAGVKHLCFCTAVKCQMGESQKNVRGTPIIH